VASRSSEPPHHSPPFRAFPMDMTTSPSNSSRTTPSASLRTASAMHRNTCTAIAVRSTHAQAQQPACSAARQAPRCHPAWLQLAHHLGTLLVIDRARDGHVKRGEPVRAGTVHPGSLFLGRASRSRALHDHRRQPHDNLMEALRPRLGRSGRSEKRVADFDRNSELVVDSFCKQQHSSCLARSSNRYSPAECPLGMQRLVREVTCGRWMCSGALLVC
jgi:hypothetical protein